MRLMWILAGVAVTGLALLLLVNIGVGADDSSAAEPAEKPASQPVPEPLKLDPAQTAVLLVEFQNEFCKEGGKLYEMTKSEIARQNTIGNGVKLAEAARKAGCMIIHIPFVYNEQWVKQNDSKGILAMCRDGEWFHPGAWGTEIIDELKPASGDIVLKGKCVLSSFAHTDLDKMLRDRGIKTVVCAGFSTNLCLESTARGAYDLGYRVLIAKDATGCGSKEAQQYVETAIAPMLGSAITVDECIAAMEK